jgi:hypothetical protein
MPSASRRHRTVNSSLVHTASLTHHRCKRKNHLRKNAHRAYNEEDVPHRRTMRTMMKERKEAMRKWKLTVNQTAKINWLRSLYDTRWRVNIRGFQSEELG